jgi:hypothetical protein
VSDSHIGFKNVPNMDVTSTFQKAIDRVGALPNRPSFILHTGDVSHTSTPAQYDTVDQIFKGAKFSQDQVYFVPGEHDTFVDNGKAYLDRFGQGSTTNGWRSIDFKGVHFVGLVNVWNLTAGGFDCLPPASTGRCSSAWTAARGSGATGQLAGHQAGQLRPKSGRAGHHRRPDHVEQ